MISRRRFLSAAGRLVPVLGGAGAVTPLLRSLAFADTRLDEILRTAPKARFWTSVALAGSDCSGCQGADRRIGDRRRDHDPNLVRCLLCSHTCAIKAGERAREIALTKGIRFP